MNLTYEKNGDYLIPTLQADNQPEGTVTKYGMMRETYLKENHRGVYSAFLLKGTLKEHLLTIQKQAEERMEKLTSQMAATEGVTEQLKETDQMLWVAKMNSIRNRAEEVVLGELVYSLKQTQMIFSGEKHRNPPLHNSACFLLLRSRSEQSQQRKQV